MDIKKAIMGRNEKDSLQKTIDLLELPVSLPEFADMIHAEQRRLFGQCKPLPGVLRLVKHLKSHRIPIWIGSSSHEKSYSLKSAKNGELFDLFDGRVLGDDAAVKRGKPAPDLFLEVCRRMGSPPVENVLVFEDSLTGMQAALAAGMHVSRCFVWFFYCKPFR